MEANLEVDNSGWRLGEVVNLPKTETLLKKNKDLYYERIVGLRYICIRGATETRRGILAKVIGNVRQHRIMIIDKQLFSKDVRKEQFVGKRYYSYPFPSEEEVKEALDIINGNPALIKKFEEESMRINPKGKFWVSKLKSRLFAKNLPQCYDASSDSLCTASENDAPCRLTLAYFYKGKLIW